MKKVNVIKGKPIYVLKGSQYVDKPDKTRVVKMLYSEDEGITYIHLKKIRHLYEIVCFAILILIVVYNRVVTHNANVVVRYNSLVNYYDGYLYLNLHAEEDNYTSVFVKIDNVIDDIMYPGDSIIRVPVDNPMDFYTIHFSYDTLLRQINFDVNVSVVDRSYKTNGY